MTQAEVHHRPAWMGGKTGQYLGVETALLFSSPAEELETIRTGCAIFALNWRALIRVDGKDRVRWLHNMVTNSIRDLEQNHGNYNFVLNAQGRILGDLYAFNRGESLLVQTDRQQVETLLTALRRFIIMDKVELSDMGQAGIGFGMVGPKAQQVLSAAGIETSSLERLEVRDLNVNGAAAQLIRGAEQKTGWYEIWIGPAEVEAAVSRLREAGARAVGAEALELWRVLRGIPQFGKDIRDRDLPQETGQTQALNFDKGCYIGQEIVERIRSRGQVHRRFTGFEFEDGLPEAGKFDAAGRTFAEVTSTARVPSASGERRLGLGYVRQDALPADGRLDLNGVKARVVNLPLENQID
jgi:folate-binding protein YgfZ